MHGTKISRNTAQRKALLIGTAALTVAIAGCGAGGSTTAELGTQGGVVSLESGLRLEVPQGALSNRVQVTLRETRLDGYSDIHIEPSGLALAAPASLGWVDDGDDTLESEGNEVCGIVRSGGRAHAEVHHFGYFRHRSHCGKDGGADGGCPGRAHDDGGPGNEHHSDGGSCRAEDEHRDGGEGHGDHDGEGCSHDDDGHRDGGERQGDHDGMWCSGDHDGGHSSDGCSHDEDEHHDDEGHCSGGHGDGGHPAGGGADSGRPADGGNTDAGVPQVK